MTKNKIHIKKTNAADTKSTLQIKHKEQMKRFSELRESLPEKKKSLSSLKRELKHLETKVNSSKYGNDEIKRRSYLKGEIQRLEKEIEEIGNHKEEINYYLNTYDILTSYFDREDDSDSEEEIPVNDNGDEGKEDIMKFFSTAIINKTKPEPEPIPRKGKKKPKEVEEAPVVPVKKESKASLYDRYMTLTNKDYNRKEPINFSVKCKTCQIDMKLNQSDGIFVCKGCGCIEYLLIESDKPNYKEPVPDSNSVATYRRINHLNEILSQIQAKESTDVPDEIFDEIYLHIKKYRIKKKDINFFSMQKILKKLGLRKYYEHASHIVFKINGCPPPTFSREMEDKIRNMFRKIQKPFEIYCPKDRKNFLSYSYVIHKFCELLELDDYLKYFPLLKNPKKLKQQDRIWKKICESLEWEFYESI